MLIIYNPVVGAISLTWVMGAWFLVGGIFELGLGFSIPSGRGWLILVGIVNILLGVWVVMLDPAQAFAFLGFLVGISLIFRGLWSLMFMSDLHRVHRFVAPDPI